MDKKEMYERIAELESEVVMLLNHSKKKFNECEALYKENEALKKEIAYYLISKENPHLWIKKVIFNKPATVVFFEDGSKSIAKCDKKDKYSKEMGLIIACGKQLLKNCVPDMDSLLDEELRHNLEVYNALNNPNKNIRLSALKEWKDLDSKARQRTKAKFKNYIAWADNKVKH